MNPDSSGIIFAVVVYAFIAAIALAALWIYFLPTYYAFRRQKQRRWLILFLNVVSGWTIFTWWLLMIWSLIADDAVWALPVHDYSKDGIK